MADPIIGQRYLVEFRGKKSKLLVIGSRPYASQVLCLVDDSGLFTSTGHPVEDNEISKNNVDPKYRGKNFWVLMYSDCLPVKQEIRTPCAHCSLKS